MFVIKSCQKIEYNALFMMIFIPVSNFGDQPLCILLKLSNNSSSNSYLKIYDGNSTGSFEFGKYKGDSQIPSFISSQNEIFIYFYTPSLNEFESVTFKGFYIEYTSSSKFFIWNYSSYFFCWMTESIKMHILLLYSFYLLQVCKAKYFPPKWQKKAKAAWNLSSQ